MLPINVAFLWHNHQPDYEMNGVSILPWTRLHAVKDYLDIPSLLEHYPNVKQNFNYVPTLVDQLINISKGELKDRVQILTEKKVKDLKNEERNEIIDQFFTCNIDNQIKRYTRFYELYLSVEAGKELSDQDIIDLQVWYNLSWVGEVSRERPKIKALLSKERNYSETDKNTILKEHLNIIKGIIPKFKKLLKKSQIDLSFSPYYHPILPLVNDSSSAKEAMPYLDLKDLRFNYSQDAEYQIKRAVDLFGEQLSYKLSGMWSSEGSLSDPVLDFMIKNGIEWTASDEDLLGNSLNSFHWTNKYFIWEYQSNNGSIHLHFRDKSLSDKIGFSYSNMDPKDAANDMLNSILGIRDSLITEHGEDVLNETCINIILDGENCWEFYPENGFRFLKELFSQLNDHEFIETVLIKDLKNKKKKVLENIKAGSWIDSNFKIWIGEKVHLRAWQLLQATRELFERRNHSVSRKISKEAYEYILKAESSDWFWWYYSGHLAPNKLDFDVLFRFNLAQVYKLLGYEIPDVFEKSLWSDDEIQRYSNINSDRASTMHQVSF